MKKIKILPIFLSLCLLLALCPLPVRATAEEPLLNSLYAMVLDRYTGRVILAKNPDTKLYPASLTKIMTVLLAVEAAERGEVSLSDEVTASPNITFDLSELGSTAGIAVGETMTLEELLYCAMLASANEACNIIAEHVAGTISGFVERMNERAVALGCTGTHFANTHGLTDFEHYTTARDLSRIALEAARHSVFMTLCGTADHTVPATNRSQERYLHNSNALVSANSTYGASWVYDGASGMKTGYTSYAGHCLVSTAERGGVSLLCVACGADTSDGCFSDSTKLLNWAFETYDPASVPAVELLVSSAPADSSIPDTAGPEIGSAAAVVMNRENGDIFFSRNGGARIYPADTVKLMTGLVAIEAVESGTASLRSEVLVSASADFDLTEGANNSLQEGESLSLEDLLYLALMSSCDDACNVIAECVAGSVPAFVERMNERASSLGCSGTHFANTHGLFDADCYSTAADMGKIALEASRHDLLSRICGTVATEIPETNLSPARTLQNTNALLGASAYDGTYTYERASGLKSGYSSAAGYCLLSSAGDADLGINLIAAVFGGVRSDPGYTHYADTIALFDYIFENYSYQEVLSPDINIASVDVNLGKDVDYVNLRPAGAVSLLLPNGYDPGVFDLALTVYSLEQGQIVTAPVTAGEVLGEVSVVRDGQSVGTVKLIAASNVELSRTQYIKTHLSDTLHSRGFILVALGLGLLLLLYILWVIAYRVRRVRYRNALRSSAGTEESYGEDFREESAAPELPPESAAPYIPEPVLAPRPTPPQQSKAADAGEIPGNVPASPEALRDLGSIAKPAPKPAPTAPARQNTESAPRQSSSQQPPAPSKPSEPPARVLPDPFADIDLKLFDSKDDRDYFEEFFKKK
ncbi:MAG: serine hydrolase [Oscillospiraceae bacterium]|nr:serine hydrolase [Oscillospiraceae bacterium]